MSAIVTIAFNKPPDANTNRHGRITSMSSIQHSRSLASLPDLANCYDHYSKPDVPYSRASVTELESEIKKYEALFRKAQPHTQNARDIVQKLVQLRLHILNIKDASPGTENGNDCKTVMGHRFQQRSWQKSKVYCEICCTVIISLLQYCYKCSNCNFCCHKSCLPSLTRICSSVKVQEKPCFALDICPEQGLHSQNYCCFECNQPIGNSPNGVGGEARLCDYTGSYFCNKCHWNDCMVIPSRITWNWDFQPRKVSRFAKCFLKAMLRKPVIDLKEMNPVLFTYHIDLNEIHTIRCELLEMKKYLVQCKTALKYEKLLCQLQNRQHFVENSCMYSLQDLMDISDELLLPELTFIQQNFKRHIERDCIICTSKGQKCTLCNNDQSVLFSYQDSAIACHTCKRLFHRTCLSSSSSSDTTDHLKVQNTRQFKNGRIDSGQIDQRKSGRGQEFLCPKCLQSDREDADGGVVDGRVVDGRN